MTEKSFTDVSDNYKQKLVYTLLDTVKANDQTRFFYVLLKAINQPKKELSKLIEQLNSTYDLMPKEVFPNYAYSIIIGIMNTYNTNSKNLEEKEKNE